MSVTSKYIALARWLFGNRCVKATERALASARPKLRHRFRFPLLIAPEKSRLFSQEGMLYFPRTYSRSFIASISQKRDAVFGGDGAPLLHLWESGNGDRLDALHPKMNDPPHSQGIVASSYSGWRASRARPSVTSSANSKSPPTGRPLASRVTVMPKGLISRAR